ncbi:hypothetical protein [Piscirickettsia litoralis]|uniref:Phosphatidate cytidylyltransferase n=1 Tax=Piscirickettsia litoralis TaxID=1891921 RepID=A0ABX3A8T3_9GAMM|nr:hypothetical protein [Piscirickettsia litoralis]ODN43855.1 hypothetical protein BGC07_14365 [Piscirickettsia litoralis]
MKKSLVILLAIISLLSCIIISLIGKDGHGLADLMNKLIHWLEWGGLGLIVLAVGLFIIFGSIVVCAAVWDELFKK